MALSYVDYFMMAEVEFGANPDATGAGFVAAQAINNPFYSHDVKVVQSKFASGRNRETDSLIGQDGASENTDFPLISLAAAATKASPTPAAKDWADYLFDAALGPSATKQGEGINTGGTTTSLVLDTDVLDVEDLACVNFSNRSEWRNVTVDAGAGTYTIAPALTASPDATRDAFGYRYWTDSDNQGASLSVYTRLGGTPNRLSGGRPSLKISGVAGAEYFKVTAGWKFDSKTQETLASIPTISTFTNTPPRVVLSPCYWGSTAVSTKMIEIDFGLSPADIGYTGGTNGRQDIANLSRKPRVTLEIPYSTTLEADFLAGTKRTLLVQMGSGALSGGRANTYCFYAQSAQIVAMQPSNDGNYLRHKVTFEVKDAGVRTGTTIYRHWIFARA